MKLSKLLFLLPIVASVYGCSKTGISEKLGDFVSVKFTGYDCSAINCPTIALKKSEVKFSLDIPFYDHDDSRWEEEPTEESEGKLDWPIIVYYVSPNDISVKIGGVDCPDAFYFYYLNNANNYICIKPEYVINDIEIVVKATPFSNLFLYGIVIGDEMWNRWIGRYGEKEVEGLTLDMHINFQTFYQRKPYPIMTLSDRKTFPVYENDNIDVTFEVIPNYDKDGFACNTPLPNDIRFRENSRYTYLGIDYEREYSEPIIYKYPDPREPEKIIYETGYRKCHLTVPHYIVNDHVSFKQFGTE